VFKVLALGVPFLHFSLHSSVNMLVPYGVGLR
jgi:hypothetical protein